jgi:hypothetical protein
MSDCFNADNQSTDSRDVAVLSVFLGYQLIRIEVSADHKEEKYTLVIPSCDFEIVTKEASDPETTVEYLGIQKANQFIGAKIAYARKTGGVWSVFTRPLTDRTRR